MIKFRTFSQTNTEITIVNVCIESALRLEEAREEDLLPPLPEALERHVKLVKDGDTLGVQASQIN